MPRFAVALAIRRTYVVSIDAESEAQARAKASSIVTPPATCINRDWRRVVSVEELDEPQGRASA